MPNFWEEDAQVIQSQAAKKSFWEDDAKVIDKPKAKASSFWEEDAEVVESDIPEDVQRPSVDIDAERFLKSPLLTGLSEMALGPSGVTGDERVAKKTARGYKLGQFVVERGKLGAEAMYGRLDDAQATERAKALESSLPEEGISPKFRWSSPKSIAEAMAGGTAELLPFMAESMFEGAKTGIKSAAAGAAAGSVIPGLGAIAGAATGFKAGSMIGAIKTSAEIEGGNLYLDLTKDGVSPEIARPVAVGTGIGIGILEAAGIGIILKRIPGLKRVFFNKVSDTVIKNPNIRQALMKMSVNFAKDVAAETGVEMTQELASIGGEILAKTLEEAKSDKELNKPGLKDVFKRLEQVAVMSAQGFPLLMLPGNVMEAAKELKPAKQAKAAEQEKEFTPAPDQPSAKQTEGPEGPEPTEKSAASQKGQETPEQGMIRRVAGVEMKAAEVTTEDGIDYELWEGKNKSAIRIKDKDSGYVVSLQVFPKFEQAKEKFEKEAPKRAKKEKTFEQKEKEFSKIVRKGGGIYKGYQKPVKSKSGKEYGEMVYFDNAAGSTLVLNPKDLTPENVAKKVKESNEKFLLGAQITPEEIKGIFFQEEGDTPAVSILKAIKEEINRGDPGGRIFDEEKGRYVDGYSSTYPDYFKNKDYEKAKVVPILDKWIAGEKITPKEFLIVQDLTNGIIEQRRKEAARYEEEAGKLEEEASRIEEESRAAEGEGDQSEETSGRSGKVQEQDAPGSSAADELDPAEDTSFDFGKNAKDKPSKVDTTEEAPEQEISVKDELEIKGKKSLDLIAKDVDTGKERTVPVQLVMDTDQEILNSADPKTFIYPGGWKQVQSFWHKNVQEIEDPENEIPEFIDIADSAGHELRFLLIPTKANKKGLYEYDSKVFVPFQTYTFALQARPKSGNTKKEFSLESEKAPAPKKEAEPDMFGGEKSFRKPEFGENKTLNSQEESALPLQEAANDEKQAKIETPPPAAADPFEAHTEFVKKLNAGEITAAELKERFQKILEMEYEIKAKLAEKTVKELVTGKVRSGTTKKEIVDSIYSQMTRRYHVGDSYGYNPMQETAMDALKREVAKTTDDDIQKYAADRKERLSGLKKSLEDPETAEEFRTFIDYKGEKALSAEQKIRWDELQAEAQKKRQGFEQERKATVQGVKLEDADFTLTEEKHSKTGEALFVVKLSKRIDAETFKTLAGKARVFSGGWSRYSGGFLFRNKANAEKFMQLKEGNVSRIEDVKAKKEEVKDNAVTRLRTMAEELEASGDERLNQDRKLNTAKRLREGESAMRQAEADKALARTMRNVADAIERGEAKHLEGIRTKAQVQQLQTILRSAQYRSAQSRAKNGGNISQDMERPPVIEDIESAQFPFPSIHKDNLMSLAAEMENRKGYIRFARDVIKHLRSIRSEDYRVVLSESSPIKSSVKELAQGAKSLGVRKYEAENILEEFREEGRMRAMGIETLPQLRAALREFLTIRQEAAKPDALKMEEAKIKLQQGGDFFTTPRELAKNLVDAADIDKNKNMDILEPSAGTGSIAEVIHEQFPQHNLVLNEINPSKAEFLRKKKIGSEVFNKDFLEINNRYDRIIMNPPFSAEIEHVRHAFDILRPGGKLVSVMSSGPFFRGFAADREFREWFESNGGERVDNPEGSFKDSGTGVNTVTINMEKPAADGSARSEGFGARSSTRGGATSEAFKGDKSSNFRKQADVTPADRIAKVVKGKLGGLEYITALEAPELLKLAKTLSNSDVRLNRLMEAFGKFWHMDGVRAWIELNRKTFKEPEILQGILAHEIGHLIDWLPDETLNRGNVLGRMASLKNYRRTLLPREKGGPSALTPKDRARIRREAERIAQDKKFGQGNIFDEAKESRGDPANVFDPDMIIGIWNQFNQTNIPENLITYVKKLGAAEKKSIVKAAFEAKKNGQKVTIEEIQVANEEYKKDPTTVFEIYKDLLKKEIELRRLFELEVIREEMKNLTRWWHPFDEASQTDPISGAQSDYIKYRFSSRELYADFISVLLNAPAKVKEIAPKTYEAFFNYLDEKSDVFDALLKIQSFVQGGNDELFRVREKDIREMFEGGEEAFRARQLRYEEAKKSMWFRIKNAFWDKNTALLDARKLIEKKKGKIDPFVDPKNILEKRDFVAGVVRSYIEKIQPVYDEIMAKGLKFDVSAYMFAKRVMGDRAELANPLGQNAKTAEAQLDYMKRTNPSRYADVERIVGQIQDWLKNEIVPVMKDVYTPEQIARASEPSIYAPFRVVDFMKDYVASGMMSQEGTLRDIGDTLTALVMKSASMVSAAARNDVKMRLGSFILQHPEMFNPTPARITQYPGVFKIQEAPDKTLGTISWRQGGKWNAYHVDSWIAEVFNGENNGLASQTGFLYTLSGAALARPLWLVYNINFQLRNLFRDIQRTWTANPNMTFGAILKAYVKAYPHAVKKVRGEYDDLINEMYREGVLGFTLNDMYLNEGGTDTELEKFLEKYGTVEQKQSKLRNIPVLKQIAKVLDAVQFAGDVIETLPKVAGWTALDNKNIPEPERAYIVRNLIGTPNYRRGGSLKGIYNPILIFSNIKKEGIRGMIELAGNSDPKVRNQYYRKVSTIAVTSALWLWLMQMGLWGRDDEEREKFKQMARKATDYDKTNYMIFFLGVNEKGEARYIRIPMDENIKLVHGITWKILDNMKNPEAMGQELLKFVTKELSLQLGPLFNVAGGWLEFMQGRSPRDDYRGYDVVGKDQMAVGGMDAFAPMLLWTANQTGLTAFNVVEMGKERGIGKTIQAITPGVSAFYRETDYGEQQIYQKAAKLALKEEAAARIDLKDSAKKYVREGENPDMSGMDREEKKKFDKYADKFEAKASQIPLSRALASAGSNAQKVEMIKAAYETFDDGRELVGYLTQALNQGLISADLLGEVMRDYYSGRG